MIGPVGGDDLELAIWGGTYGGVRGEDKRLTDMIDRTGRKGKTISVRREGRSIDDYWQNSRPTVIQKGDCNRPATAGSDYENDDRSKTVCRNRVIRKRWEITRRKARCRRENKRTESKRYNRTDSMKEAFGPRYAKRRVSPLWSTEPF